jgi:GT2 family glycosyltransferase
MVDVAVIMINYNASDYTLKCIQSVMDKTDPTISFQITVVDNNSEPADYENLRNNFPKNATTQLIRSEINTGFGGGNMTGALLSKATYYLFLNNDTLLLNDCLSLLKAYMDANPSVGLSTAQNYNEYGKLVPSFDHNKGVRRLLFGRGFLERLNPKRYPKRSKEYSKPIAVDWVNGAFLFFQSEAFHKIGGFDTNIFLYWEEMDLCIRLRRKGYESRLVPHARIVHYQGVSIGKSKAINKEAYRSYLYVIRKHYGLWKLRMVQCYLLVVFMLKPKKRYLLSTILEGSSMQNSLKHQQLKRL